MGKPLTILLIYNQAAHQMIPCFPIHSISEFLGCKKKKLSEFKLNYTRGSVKESDTGHKDDFLTLVKWWDIAGTPQTSQLEMYIYLDVMSLAFVYSNSGFWGRGPWGHLAQSTKAISPGW